MEKQANLDNLIVPHDERKVLLHCCCAPCSGSIIQSMLSAKIEITLFYYNPNIYPKAEYDLRKTENKNFASNNNIEFIDADYDHTLWIEKTKGLEDEPEQGKRCSVCFDMRFEKTAEYAQIHGFRVFTSTLGISSWKDQNQINASGLKASQKYPNLTYWTYNWRKQGGAQKMYEIAKHKHFYKQEYCGCPYSLRDANNHRQKTGKPLISHNQTYQ